jgi:hypothetical protein
MATDADQEWATELAREVLVQDSAIDTVSPDLRLAVAASRILAAVAKRDAEKFEELAHKFEVGHIK